MNNVPFKYDDSEYYYFFFERRGELGQAHDIKDKEGCDIGLEAHW